MLRRTSRLTLAVLLTLPLAAAASSPATAAATWLPAAPLATASATGDGVTVDLDAAGNAVAVWSQASGGELQVVASSRPSGGAWSTPVPLSAAGAAAVHPEVVLADDGRATAVWFRATGPSTYALQSSFRSAAGAWTSAADLPGTSDVASRAALALRPGGAVVLVWPRNVGGSWFESSAERPVGGGWGAPVDLDAASTSSPGAPTVGVDGTGLATALWASGTAPAALRFATSPLSGPWSPAGTLSAPGQPAADPARAVASDGTAIATWSRFDGTSWSVQTATRFTVPGGWTGLRDLSTGDWSSTASTIGTNNFGERYIAAWTAVPASGHSVVQAAILGPQGWEPAQTMSDPSTDADVAQVAVTRSNAASLVWRQGAGGQHVIRGALMGATSDGFAAAATLSTADRDATGPRLATDLVGDAVAVWGDAGPSDFATRYAVYDAGAPVLPDFKVSGRVAIGHPARYQATALDAWSTVASYSWSIEGDTTTGPTATHVFHRLGRYHVTLTVTDSAGNVTKRVARTKVVPVVQITSFKLSDSRISTSEKTRLRLALSAAADVRIVLRSKSRHDVGAPLKHRIKILVKKHLPAGASVVTIKGSKLVPDTWVVTGVAREVGVDSVARKKLLVVTG
jgi:hypothetical protein